LTFKSKSRIEYQNARPAPCFFNAPQALVTQGAWHRRNRRPPPRRAVGTSRARRAEHHRHPRRFNSAAHEPDESRKTRTLGRKNPASRTRPLHATESRVRGDC